MDCLDEIDDPRKPDNGTLHDFQEILVIAIAAMLSDCDTVEDIAFEDISFVANGRNHRPRRYLGYKTPHALFTKHLHSRHTVVTLQTWMHPLFLLIAFSS